MDKIPQHKLFLLKFEGFVNVKNCENFKKDNGKIQQKVNSVEVLSILTLTKLVQKRRE